MANYTVDSIDVHLGLEGPRHRPDMYIGDTSIKGLHHCLWEIIDNSMDEHANGYGNELHITVHKDGSVSVRDFGRGIPIDVHSVTGLSGVETVLTILHAGGKMGSDSYEKTGGLHGVGASVVNALSEFLEVVVNRDRKQLTQRYEKGKKVSEVLLKGNYDAVGTYIRFKPDREIFKDESLDWSDNLILYRLECLSYLNNCSFKYVNERTRIKRTIHAIPNGFELGVNRLCGIGILADPVVFKSEENDMQIGIQVTARKMENSFVSFVNNIPTPLGGSHESGVKSALVKFVNAVSGKSFKSDDIIKNCFVFLKVKLSDPRFRGQIKEELSKNESVQGRVFSWVYQELMGWNQNDPKSVTDFIKTIEKRIKSQQEETEDQEQVKFKNFNKRKLTFFVKKDFAKNELFIVEGDSAGGTAKKAKNDYQAVLPLRGKFSNVIKKNMKTLFEDKEIQSIISAIGGVGEDFSINKCPYSKIIIMADADDDGAHIVTLLLSLFYVLYRELFEKGYIYVAQSPLFFVDYRKQRYFFFNRSEMDEFTKGKNGYEVKRFKGLGEMDHPDLKKTSMNPDTRRLIRVNVSDAEECHRTLHALMGKNTSDRKSMIDEIY